MGFIEITSNEDMQYRAHPLPCRCLVRELADGVLSFAAVLRGCLGQPTPPLCRCAEYTADLLLRLWVDNPPPDIGH